MDSVASEVVDPREYQSRRETKSRDDDQNAKPTLSDAERREDDLGELENHERCSRIGEREPHHVSAAHLGQELAESGRLVRIGHLWIRSSVRPEC